MAMSIEGEATLGLYGASSNLRSKHASARCTNAVSQDSFGNKGGWCKAGLSTSLIGNGRFCEANGKTNSWIHSHTRSRKVCIVGRDSSRTLRLMCAREPETFVRDWAWI